MATSFEDKCKILGELWSEMSDEEEWEEFCSTYNIGLPLSFFIDVELVKEISPGAKMFINQAFSALLGKLTLADKGWASLEEILDTHEEKKYDDAFLPGAVPESD